MMSTESAADSNTAPVVSFRRRGASTSRANLRKKGNSNTSTATTTVRETSNTHNDHEEADKNVDNENDNDKNPIVDLSSSDEDELGIDKQKLEDLKLLHSLNSRNRKEGISAEVLLHGNRKDRKLVGSEKDIKASAFSSQFNSRMDHGIQTQVPHEKLMEDYISEKLGLKKHENM